MFVLVCQLVYCNKLKLQVFITCRYLFIVWFISDFVRKKHALDVIRAALKNLKRYTFARLQRQIEGLDPVQRPCSFGIA